MAYITHIFDKPVNARQIYYTKFYENLTSYLVGNMTSQEGRRTNERKCIVWTEIIFTC